MADTQTVQLAPAKPAKKSTTIWINALIVIAVVLKVVLMSHSVTDPDLLAIVVGIVNIINRFNTTQPIAL